MRGMRVLFLTLPDPSGMFVNRDYCGGFGSAFPTRGKERHSVFPPIFDAYVASILENEGHMVSIIDAPAEKVSEAQLLERIGKEDPEVIVSRISLPSFKNDLKIADMVKIRFSSIFYAGWGSICKVEPETALSKSSLDAVIRDEVEFVVPNLLKTIENNGKIGDVKGVSFKTSSKIVHASSLISEKSLDALPLPAYHLLDMKKYVARESYFFPEGSRKKFVNFFTLLSSRGCNFNCLYCPYPTSFGHWRGMSPKKVVDEMDFLAKNYGIRIFWFHDQVFTMIPERVEEMCNEIRSRGLSVNWACETHVGKLSGELVRKMKEAGCTRIQVGIETGDPQLLANVGKRGSTVEEVEKAICQLHEEGILVEANFIVGLPGENWDTIKNTARMIRKIKPDDVAISMITPYPGTPLFVLAKQNNWLITEDWNKYSTSHVVMAFPDFSEEDMKEAQRYLYGTFMYYTGLNDLTGALRKRRFRRFFRRLVVNLPEIGFGAYALSRFALKSKVHLNKSKN